MKRWLLCAPLLLLTCGCEPRLCREKDCACGGTDCNEPSQHILDEDGGRSRYGGDGGPVVPLGPYETDTCDRCGGRPTYREGSGTYFRRCRHSTIDGRIMCEHQSCGTTCSY